MDNLDHIICSPFSKFLIKTWQFVGLLPVQYPENNSTLSFKMISIQVAYTLIIVLFLVILLTFEVISCLKHGLTEFHRSSNLTIVLLLAQTTLRS